MKRSSIFTFIAVAMLIMVSIAGADVGSLLKESGSEDDGSPLSKSQRDGRFTNARNYRSPGNIRKVVIATSNTEALTRARESGAVEVSDYGSFKLLVMNESALEAMEKAGEQGSRGAGERRSRGAGEQGSRGEESHRSSEARARAPLHPRTPAPLHSLTVRDDYNLLLLRSGAIDTTADESAGNFFGLSRAAGMKGGSAEASSSQQGKAAGSRLRLIQFVGPVKRAWLDQLAAFGFDLIAYVPNNGYLVRGDAGAVAMLHAARERGDEPVQWEGPFTDDYKVDPRFRDVLKGGAGGEVMAAVQVARTSSDQDQGWRRDLETVMSMASEIISKPYQVMGFINLKIRIKARRISDIAALENVINIEPWQAPELLDERAARIVTGDVGEDGKTVGDPGYLSWLQSRGLASRFNFAIDVADTGLDRGKTGTDELHPDFLDSSGQSRVLYARDYTGELDAGDVPGHGTINVSIAGGANFSTDAGARDSSQYGHGIGIAPFALLGSSKIFRADAGFGLAEPYTNLISAAYRDGARISSNSWGAVTNSYTIDSQEYDSRARDALPTEPGNQEMVIVFAAGNASRDEAVSSPGTGKNLISVAASEGVRGGEDGCGIIDEDADNAFDIVFFSSGGPLDDGRMKPDIAAPGTHIQGAASQHPDFEGSRVCGEDFDKPYFPAGQTLYTWSSGTSHATPQVAGAAALVRQIFLNRGQEASAAFVKAMLLNSTRYIAGELAGGSLPHLRQGWGLMDIGRALDDTPRILVDQTHTFTESGQEMIITGQIRDPARPFRVTLCWSDAPGFSAFAPWVNDLDLEITINGQVYNGNNFKGDESQAGGEPDTRNNVESVWLPAGTAGAFAIRVRAANIAGDGVPGNLGLADQDFALVVYNAEKRDVGVAALASVAVTGGADSVIEPGETASLKIGLRNSSPVSLTGGQGVLATATSGIAITSATSNFPNIASGGTGENLQELVFTVASDVACGTLIDFTLEVSHQGTFARIPFQALVGREEPVELFEDDVESGEAKWTHASGIKKKKKRVDTWERSTQRFRSGGQAWFTSDLDKVTDAHLDTIPVQLPAEGRNIELVFYHTFSLEGNGFDGGVIEISTGEAFEDLGDKILKGGYTGGILDFSGNPLGGRRGWVGGRLGDFKEVVVDLSSYAGQTVIIRFRIGTDSSIAGMGWYIDDVTIGGNRVLCAP
ncbi:MAG: S8 family serine peptidase [Blastocatellia bacterium]|nr:S8 family serine peptidase [Blastocatellia bacterium]